MNPTAPVGQPGSASAKMAADAAASGGWQAMLQQPVTDATNGQLYGMARLRQTNPSVYTRMASQLAPWARTFLGLDDGTTPGAASGTTPGASAGTAGGASSATQLSDQQLAIQNADRLRAAAAALTTGPTPVGAQAAQQAQSALGGASKTTNPLTGTFARGGKVRRFQSGGANDGTQTTTPAAGGSAQTTDPTGGAYWSWTPAQQQAYGNGVPVAQVNAMAAPAAAAPAAGAGTNYQYNPYVSPDQNPAPPTGYVAVPFGTGTSVVPSGDLAYQNFLALQNSPFMTPAAIQNQAIVGNAGLPGSLQGGNATLPLANGQTTTWNQMTPAQQYMYEYLLGTGQAIPANFMSQYQGPSAAWNDPSLNSLGVPQGQSIVNGALVNTPTNTSSPGGIGTSPGTFTSNATGAGVGTGSGSTGTTSATTATPQVTQSPTGSAGSGAGLGLKKGGKVPRQRPRRFQAGGFNAAPGGGGNWQQALQQMIQNAQAGGGAQMMPQGGQFPSSVTGTPGMGGAQGMGAAAGAMPPGPGAAAMGAMAGAMPGIGQPQMPGAGQGAASAGMGAMAGAMPGSPGAAAMGALAGASQGAPGGGQNMQLLQALQALRGGQRPGMGGTFGPMPQAAAPGTGAGPGSTYGATATPNQQWGQMLLGSAPGTGLMNQGQANPMGQQALWRNYLGQLQGGLGMTGQGTGMAEGGAVPPRPDEHNDTTGAAPVDPRHGSHYRVPLAGGEHELASHPDTQWGLIADGEKRAYADGGRFVVVPASREARDARLNRQTGGTIDESPKTHATGVPMSRRKATGGVSDPLPERHASGVPYRKATGGGVDTAPTHHASGVPIKGSPKGGQPLGTVSKFNSTKGAPGNLATTAAGRGRGFAKGGVTGSKGTLDSTKPAPGNLATSQAGHDRFAEGGVAAFAAGGSHEAVQPKTSKTVLRRRPAAMPHSPRRRPVPTPPFRDQDNEDAMGPAPTAASAPAPAPAPAAPPPAPPPFAKGGAVCASCGKAHGGACKGMARGGKFAGSKQRAIRRAGGGKWVQDAIKKPGALRAQLGVKGDQKIPAGKLAKAAKAPGKLGQRARLAQTMRGFKHAKGGAAACPDCGKQHSGSCKMAAGGVAKVRRGFPNTLKPPKRLARGGTVRGGGAAKRGLKFSGVF